MTGGIEEDDLSLSTVWCLQFEQCRLMQISENALARAADDPMDSLNPVAALYSAETLQAVRDRAADRDRMNSELSIDNPPDLDSLKSWKGIEFALMLLDYDLTATDPIFLMGYRPHEPGFKVPTADAVHQRLRFARRLLSDERMKLVDLADDRIRVRDARERIEFAGKILLAELLDRKWADLYKGKRSVAQWRELGPAMLDFFQCTGALLTQLSNVQRLDLEARGAEGTDRTRMIYSWWINNLPKANAKKELIVQHVEKFLDLVNKDCMVLWDAEFADSDSLACFAVAFEEFRRARSRGYLKLKILVPIEGQWPGIGVEELLQLWYHPLVDRKHRIAPFVTGLRFVNQPARMITGSSMRPGAQSKYFLEATLRTGGAAWSVPTPVGYTSLMSLDLGRVVIIDALAEQAPLVYSALADARTEVVLGIHGPRRSPGSNPKMRRVQSNCN